MIAAADDYPLVDLMWTFVLFFALCFYFWMVITVFSDLFRRSTSPVGARPAGASSSSCCR